MFRLISALLLFLALCDGAVAQMYQRGPATRQHVPMYCDSTGSPLCDSGPALGSTLSPGISELGITNSGTPFCINDAPVTQPYHQMCFGTNAAGNGLITLQNYGGAAAQGLLFSVNGITYPFPQAVQSGLPAVSSTAALSALGASSGPRVVKDGYRVLGDMPSMVYYLATGACPTPDGGSQIPSSDGNCWKINLASAQVDALVFGAQCNSSTDSTSAIAAAAAYFHAASGGVVNVSCPLTVSAGNINLYGGTKLLGVGAGAGYPGQNSTWPPTSGAAINCTNQTNPCINLSGPGIEIGNLLVGNSEPTPAGGTYTPTPYPYVISAACAGNWSSVYIHDMTFTSTYKGIDLEGCSDYTSFRSGGTSIIERINFNVVFNNAIRAHLIDYTPLRIRDVEGWSNWNYSVPSLGAYLRSNLTFLDIEYCAACMLSGIETPPAKYGIWLANGTVNNPSPVTLAFVGTMTQMNFQNSCQAIAGTDPNLSVWLNITDSAIWGDQSGFQCSKGLPMISLPSNFVYLGLGDTFATSIDTLLNLGCGTPGTGSCPSGASAVQAFGRLSNLFVNTFATNTAAAPLIEIPSTTVLSMQNTDPIQLIPANGHSGAFLFGPGNDGTQGCQRPLQMGGGYTTQFGAVTISDSCPTLSTTSGLVAFFKPGSASAQGSIGSATSAGVSLTAGTAGSVFIKGNAGSAGIQVGATGSTLNLIESGLPSSAPSGACLGGTKIDTTANIYYDGTKC